MNRLMCLASFILVTMLACNQENVTKLKVDGDEKFFYYASELHGYRMSIFKHVGTEYIQYAIRLNGNGEVMYVYKTAVTKGNDDDELTSAGPTWYLVSDTTDTVYGAEFFNREILGYYGSTESNFIRGNNFRGKSIRYLEEEKEMFLEVAQLMKKKKQIFIPFDSTRNLFWFKYDLQ